MYEFYKIFDKFQAFTKNKDPMLLSLDSINY